VVTIRIPRDQWGPVWQALVAAGPVSRVSEEPIYLVTDSQLRLLQRKKLPFEIVDSSNGHAAGKKHG
jgi:hypothetical protein